MTETQNEKLRIALFTETFLPKLDGVVTITCLLLDHFKRTGIEAIVFSPGHHVEDYKGFPVISITPGIPMPMYPEITMSIPGRKSTRILSDFDPTLIHVINPWSAGLQAMRLARKMDKPLVISFHTHLMKMAQFYKLGFLERILWPVHRFVYNKADMRFATSLKVIDELESHGFKKTYLWKRGVNTEQFSPSYASHEMRQKLTNDNPDKLLLLFVGRIAAEKQIEQLRNVLTDVPNTHLAIIGDGPFRPQLEKIFSGLPVTFTGYMKGQELSTAYASSDIFVFPSAIETFGLVIAEAMASGIPVVTSNVGGVPEIIEHGVNGLVFEPNDVPAMVKHVQYLAAHPEERKAMGERSCISIANRTWEAIMDELVDNYRMVIRQYHSK